MSPVGGGDTQLLVQDILAFSDEELVQYMEKNYGAGGFDLDVGDWDELEGEERERFAERLRLVDTRLPFLPHCLVWLTPFAQVGCGAGTGSGTVTTTRSGSAHRSTPSAPRGTKDCTTAYFVSTNHTIR